MEPSEQKRQSCTSKCSRYTVDLERRCTAATLLSWPLGRQNSMSLTESNLQSQWEIVMRKFSNDHKRGFKCQFQGKPTEGTSCESRPLKRFPTGSTYEGTWNDFGLSGYGIYTFPNGVVYEGQFEDNMFHGDGEMRYPDGTKLRGKWSNGDLIDRTIVFADGVHYKADDSWTYCKPADRRYASELKNGIQPAGRSFISKHENMKNIPDGTFDVGDGFYDPKTNNIYDYNDHLRVIRIADSHLKSWIKENCRVSPDGPVGPQPELYKPWVTPTLEPTLQPTPTCLSKANSEESFDIENIMSDITEMASVTPAASSCRSRASKTSSIRKSKVDQVLVDSVSPAEVQETLPEVPNVDHAPPKDSFKPDVQRQTSKISLVSLQSQIWRLREKLEDRDRKYSTIHE